MIIEVNTFNEIHNMGLVNAVNYSINDRVAIIIQEVQDYLDQCEKRAREILGFETKENK